MNEVTYESAGVNRAVGERTKEKIKEIVRSSHNNNVLKGIGLFSGFYALNRQEYTEPVLVSSIDGIGTKVKIAQMVRKYESIGVDLVNHCVNDIMVCGADPIFFLDYVAADKLDIQVVTEIVRGIALACKEADCALVGGETAEMPEVYSTNNFDVAGCMVGLVDKSAIIDGSKVTEGNVVIGAASAGLHTNGYSLARKVLLDINSQSVADYIEDTQSTLGEELLRTHRSYRVLIRALRELDGLNGVAHITGGGIAGNTTRLLAPNLDLYLDWSAWEIPPIFQIIKANGNISDLEMRSVFNLGIGLTLIVKEVNVDQVLDACDSAGETAYVIGEIVRT